MGRTWRSVAPAIVAGVTVVLALATVVLAVTHSKTFADVLSGYTLAALIWTLAFGLIGALVLRDAPGNRLGPLFAAMGWWIGFGNVSGLVASQLAAGSTAQGWAALANSLWTPVICGFLILPLIYPDGRAMSPRWVLLLRVSVASTATSFVLLAISPDALGDSWPDAHNPLALPVVGDAAMTVSVILVITVVGSGIVAMVGQLLRTRQASRTERARVIYLAAALVLMLGAMPVGLLWLNFTLQSLGALCLWIGVLRHRLFDIERVLSRSVVYLLVIGAALVAALLTAALLGSISQVGALPGLVAAVTALVLAGAFSRMARVVERVLFGPRPDPVTALALLGERLAAVPDPDGVLPSVVTTVREALRLPFAAITFVGESAPAAADGQRPERVVAYQLLYGGQSVGSLELGLRGGESELSARDARLVSSLAAQAGAVAHSAQSARELRRSREQIVAAREEERRAMRRDLHDGLGPALAGMALGLESLQRGAVDNEQARLAGDVLAQTRQSLDEVRRMARDLRPAPLDELGLAEALRHHARMARRMSGGQPDVQVIVDGDLPDLPAAVEVAAYRITQEAVANTTRHAGATRCWVELSANGSLMLSVRDDGSGICPDRAGTGLRSMRERADELGGICTVTFAPGVGTTVRAELPLIITSVDAGSRS